MTTRGRSKKKYTTLAVAAALVLAACGDERSTTDTTQAPATTVAATDAPPATDSMPAPETTAGDDGVLNVPEDFATIQAAVDQYEKVFRSVLEINS